MKSELESHSVPKVSAARTCLISAIIFIASHLAFLTGIETPDKFVFDEFHYVPAARQMLLPVMPEPMLNPMHPPLAKQIIAFSIRNFGDNPLGWRYPSALFGALAIVAVYLCGLALFAAQGPAIAAALIAFFNQMLFVEARTAMLDIFALTFGLYGTAAFLYGFRKAQPFGAFALSGLAFGLAAACKWSGLFPLAVCIVDRRRDQADAKLAHAVCRSAPDRLVSAGPLARASRLSCRDLFRACAGADLSRELRAAVRLLAA